MDKRFLNKVVDQIVNETTIDHDEERFLPPFTPPHHSLFFVSSLSPFSPYPSFIIHCREVYGLNKEEIDYVWDKYILLIKYGFSMDKKFLNKVVDQIVRETTIDHVKKVVQFPMYTSSFSSNIQLTSFFPPFRYHCEDIYGLNEQEIEYVWEEYKKIINDNLKNNG